MPLEYQVSWKNALRQRRYADAIREAEQQMSLVLTETCRSELLALLAASANPDTTLKGCMNVYEQAIRCGDTSVSFLTLQHAARPIVEPADYEQTAR